MFDKPKSSIPVAAGAAVLDLFEEENVLQRVLEHGMALRAGIEEITRESPYVAEVRGRGLYVDVEIVADRDTLAVVGEMLGPDVALEGFAHGATARRGEPRRRTCRPPHGPLGPLGPQGARTQSAGSRH